MRYSISNPFLLKWNNYLKDILHVMPSYNSRLTEMTFYMMEHLGSRQPKTELNGK